MKIKFKKLKATGTFMKLFGVDGSTSHNDSSKNDEPDNGYEYYYKRGHTYYFRNDGGDKFSIDFKDSQAELVRGSKYKMDDINNHRK